MTRRVATPSAPRLQLCCHGNHIRTDSPNSPGSRRSEMKRLRSEILTEMRGQIVGIFCRSLCTTLFDSLNMDVFNMLRVGYVLVSPIKQSPKPRPTYICRRVYILNMSITERRSSGNKARISFPLVPQTFLFELQCPVLWFRKMKADIYLASVTFPAHYKF